MNEPSLASRIDALDTFGPETAHVAAVPGARRKVARIAAHLATPAILCGLIILSLAFFWPVVFLHRVLLPGDILYHLDPVWRSPGAEQPPAANPLDSDALTEFYPWTALAAQAIHRGIIPLWNPYAFAGTPFLAAMQTAVLYPVNLALELLLPPSDVLGARAVAHLAITLAGAFLFARALAMSRPAAALVAVTFGLSLPFVVWLEHPMSGATSWLPWLLLAIDRLIRTRRTLLWTVALAMFTALEVLAGHGETTAHVVTLCAAYAAFRLMHPSARAVSAVSRRTAVLAVAGAALVGAAMAGAHLLPSLAQLPLSQAAADRTGAASTSLVGVKGDPTAWLTLVGAVVPNFFGNPTWHVTLLPSALGYNEVALYVGLIPLLLAAFALRRRGAVALFFASVAFVALGVALRAPLLGMLDDLPMIRIANNGRLRLEYAFAVAVLAGLGLDALRQQPGTATYARWARAWLLAAAATTVAALVPLSSNAASWPAALQLCVPPLCLAAFIVTLRRQQKGLLNPRASQWLAVTWCAIDLATLGSAYHATVPHPAAVAIPPAVRAVHRDHSVYRIAGLGAALWPSLSSLYGLQDIRGYDPAYDASYERYFAASFSSQPGMRLSLGPFGPGPAEARALDLLNVKYLFADCAVVLNEHVYRPVYHRGSACVYRNDAVLPRAFVTHRIAWASPNSAIELIGRGHVNPRETVILDPRDRPTIRALARPHARRAADSVQIERYALNNVLTVAHMGAPGVVVLADAYAPGWTATIDGRPAAVMRADAIMRGVAVGAGTHMVSFSYQPPLYRLGVIISVVGLAVWALLALTALGHVWTDVWRSEVSRRRRADGGLCRM